MVGATRRRWDVSDVLLRDAAMWATYQPLMRADFRLFDEYAFGRQGEPPLAAPITAFWAAKDRRVTEAMVREWARFTAGGFSAAGIDGHHLFVMGTGEQREAKQAWHAALVAALSSALQRCEQQQQQQQQQQ